MKKLSTKIILTLLLFASNKIIAQILVANYSFSQAVTVYTPISGGTELGDDSNDDDTFDNIPIGFTFTFCSATHTEVSISANGYLKFGSVLNNSTYDPISDASSDDSLVSVMGSDIESNTNGTLTYTTIGTSPNQIFIAQWEDYTQYGESDNFYFQIRLYETSNVIETFYGNFYCDQTAEFYEVGLRGDLINNNDFNNRYALNSTNTWSTSTAGTNNADNCEISPGFTPDDGLHFVWSPPPPCSGPPNAGTTTCTSSLACVGQTFGLNLVNSTVATGLSYQWESSPTAAIWTPIASATNIAQTETFTAPMFYRCIVACVSATSASTPTQVIGQTPNTYTTTPYLENFDNTWENRCDVRNVPVSANWRSNPTTGDDSWRRQDDGISANWSSSNGINIPFTGIGCANFNSYDAAYLNTGNMDLFINLNSSGNYQLSFYHINISGDDSLEVFLSIDGGSTFVKQDAFYSADYSSIDANWNKKIISLVAPNSPTCVIRFTGTSDYGADDIGMDSLQIKCAGPSLTVAAAQPTVCNGSSLSIVASGATSYTWSTSANTSSIVVTPSVNTTYTVHGENIPGCASIKTVTVGVVQGPAISLNAQPTASFCPGMSGTLVAAGATNGYTWNPGNQQFAIILVAPTTNVTYTIVGANTDGCTTTTMLSIYMTTCTSIYDPNIASETVHVFPNPSNGLFVVELANGLQKEIDVLDLTGRIVLNTTTLDDRTDLDITNLSNGVYYIRLRSNNETKVFKVVKE